jgi:hypothetical protein
VTPAAALTANVPRSRCGRARCAVIAEQRPPPVSTIPDRRRPPTGREKSSAAAGVEPHPQKITARFPYEIRKLCAGNSAVLLQRLRHLLDFRHEFLGWRSQPDCRLFSGDSFPCHASRCVAAQLGVSQSCRQQCETAQVFAMDNSEQVSIRLPVKLRVELERIAAEQDRTLSNTIRRIVVQALRQGEGQVAA